MKVTIGEGGDYHVVLTRAEGHTLIWGMRAWNVIRWNLKQQLVALEDELDGDTFDAIADEAVQLSAAHGYKPAGMHTGGNEGG